jgi:hypothetical protein
MTSSGVMVTWGCTYGKDNPFNLSVDIVDLKYVFSLLREENERSAEAVVTGKFKSTIAYHFYQGQYRVLACLLYAYELRITLPRIVKL